MPLDMAAHPEFRAKIHPHDGGVQEFRRASCIAPNLGEELGTACTSTSPT
ncbi:MAG: hypothetical protein WDM92_08365 [Caulobacteraceae bacterium]